MFRAAKEIRELKSNPASKVPLRRLNHFVPVGHTCHTWHLLSNKDRCARGRHRPIKSRHFFSRGRDRAAPLPTHLLRICAGALKCPEQWGIPKLANGQRHTSSRQGVLVCGALRLPHDLICLPLLFPQNSLRDFCGNPERQESAFSPFSRPLHRGGYNGEAIIRNL